jgi:hypothetical protein
MKRKRLKVTHVTINEQESAQAVKIAKVLDPEANLSALIRQMTRTYISKGGKI